MAAPLVRAQRLYREYLHAVRDSATTLASSRQTDATARESAAAAIAARFPTLQPDNNPGTGRIVAALGMVLRAE